MRIAAAVIAAIVGAAIAGVVTRDALYWGRPLPGVAVRDVEPQRELTVVVDGKPRLVRAPLVEDAAATEAAAVEAVHRTFLRRLRQLLDPSPPAVVVDPVLVPSPEAARVAASLERGLPEPAPARIARGASGFAVVPSRPGRRLDRRAFLRAVKAAVLAGESRVVAPLRDVEPALSTAVAEEAAATAREVTAEPVRLLFRDRSVGDVDPQRLARLVRFEPRNDRFVVTFDAAGLARLAKPLLRPWRAKATNARFRVEGAKVRILPSRPGLGVNERRVLREVTAAAYSRDRRVAALALKQVPPELTTHEAEALGIRERISTFTTDMGPSSSNRIHNVHLMADYIDGTIVRPGEAFSFNDRVGPRTVERGFLEGQMIVGSLLLPSIGGGVCQTATTLFNNAFELGLPIVERHNHSFYISHYPMGRDATVAWGGPDFIFRNDLDSAILIKARYTADTLTFSFYGTDPGRRVVTDTGPQVNWRSPETTYAVDPYAPRGSVRLVSGSNQPGFDVTVTRRVFEGDELVREDAFTSRYVAVGPTRIYGPGTSPPGPYFVIPRV